MSDDRLREAREKLEDIKRGMRERAQNLQPGQCPGCGAYRLDGKPPAVHERGCPWRGDVNPLDYLAG